MTRRTPHWTPEEKAIALEMKANGLSDWAIASRIGRTAKAVNAFLASPSRHHPSRRRSVEPAYSRGEAIGLCREQQEFEAQAREGSERLRDTILAVFA